VRVTRCMKIILLSLPPSLNSSDAPLADLSRLIGGRPYSTTDSVSVKVTHVNTISVGLAEMNRRTSGQTDTG
jgi:hypothetical protein